MTPPLLLQCRPWLTVYQRRMTAFRAASHTRTACTAWRRTSRWHAAETAMTRQSYGTRTRETSCTSSKVGASLAHSSSPQQLHRCSTRALTRSCVTPRMSGHTDSVTSCAFSFNGDYIATGPLRHTTLHLDTLQCSLLAHPSSCPIHSVSSDCVTGSMDGTVRVWRAADGTLLHVLEGCTADIEWLQFHPSGPVLVCGSADCSVWLWHAVSGQCMLVLSGHSSSVLCGCFSGDGKLVVTGDEAGCVCVWSPKTGALVHRHDTAHDGPATAITAHPTRRIAISGGLDGVCRVWSLDTGKALGALRGHSESIESVACSGQAAASSLAATGGVDGLLCVWDLNTQQLRVTCHHPDAVTAVRFDSTQPLCYSTCMDGVVRCWDALNGQLLAAWEGHSAAALCLAVVDEDNGKRRLVSGSDDHACLVFAFNANTRDKLDTSHTLTAQTQQQPQQQQ